MCLLQPHSCFFATREFELYLHKITIEPMTRIYLIPTILVLLLAVGCHHADDRLVGLDAISDSAPQAVLDSLACIDRATLSEADRHYYDFLSVKAADKAYITHSSDSLILSVVDYASNHQSHGYYPEALYYCGRVYSDLGDYPTALTYFHQALDQLPETAANRKLRGNIISQTGRLLINLRLYDQAVTYLDKVIEMERQDSDTTNLVFDLQLLGHLYINSGQYDIAQKTIIESLLLSRNLKPSHAAKSRMYLADISYLKGNIDSALYYIRGTKDIIDPLDYNSVLISNTRIFLKAGILDSAYLYAHEIINCNDPVHKEIAYNKLLSPELSNFINIDTANVYIRDYANLLESAYNANQNQLAVTQQAMYNYKQHDEARVKAEKRERETRYWLAVVAAILLVSIIIILLLKYRNQKNLIRLHVALETIDGIRNDFESKITTTSNLVSDADALRKILREKIIKITADTDENFDLPQALLQSDPYKFLQEQIRLQKPIPEDSRFWSKLEKIIIDSYPLFKTRLELLSRGKLSTPDFRTALLIKCNISPTNMSYLCSRSRSSINSRRASLAKKLFGETMDTKSVDSLIRLL